ncbi:hypothetical protein HDU99_004804 [Rhizoclosmatium hyalinum]|nr:hypothetical protein HDU99_004804 [Rhizoclosmatium hyalinum]
MANVPASTSSPIIDHYLTRVNGNYCFYAQAKSFSLYQTEQRRDMLALNADNSTANDRLLLSYAQHQATGTLLTNQLLIQTLQGQATLFATLQKAKTTSTMSSSPHVLSNEALNLLGLELFLRRKLKKKMYPDESDIGQWIGDFVETLATESKTKLNLDGEGQMELLHSMNRKQIQELAASLRHNITSRVKAAIMKSYDFGVTTINLKNATTEQRATFVATQCVQNAVAALLTNRTTDGAPFLLLVKMCHHGNKGTQIPLKEQEVAFVFAAATLFLRAEDMSNDTTVVNLMATYVANPAINAANNRGVENIVGGTAQVEPTFVLMFTD